MATEVNTCVNWCLGIGVASVALMALSIGTFVTAAIAAPPMQPIAPAASISVIGSWLMAALAGPAGSGTALWCWLSQETVAIDPVRGRLVLGTWLAAGASLITHAMIGLLCWIAIALPLP